MKGEWQYDECKVKMMIIVIIIRLLTISTVSHRGSVITQYLVSDDDDEVKVGKKIFPHSFS